MKSVARGKPISAVEVTNVSVHGFWLLIRDRELFVPFAQFPWFKDAPIGHLLNVELPQPHHLYWPDLDVDLHIDSIEDPKRYPLVSKGSPNTRAQPPGPLLPCSGKRNLRRATARR